MAAKEEEENKKKHKHCEQLDLAAHPLSNLSILHERLIAQNLLLLLDETLLRLNANGLLQLCRELRL